MNEIFKEPVEVNDEMKIKIPGWTKKENVKKVKDPDTGKDCLQIDQALPRSASVDAKHVKASNVFGRNVGRREWRDAKRYTKTLGKSDMVEVGEKIAIPLANGSEAFFDVVRSGWLSVRYFDFTIRNENRRRIIIDNGPGAAELRPDPGMTMRWRTKEVTVEE